LGRLRPPFSYRDIVKDKFIEIFKGLNVAYGKFVPGGKNEVGKVKGEANTIRCPGGIPEELWGQHLNGQKSLGIIPIDEKNKCRWGCIDIDSYNGFDHLELITKIRKHGLPLIVCRSKSGGAHVFMFFTVPVKASSVQSRLKDFASFLGCAGSEIFPKQVSLLIDKGQVGNFLNLPYFGGDESERHALDDQGQPCSVEQFYTLYDVYAQPDASKNFLKLEDFFEEGPPCLNILHQNGIPEGGRNETLTNIAVYFKKSGKTEFLVDLLNSNKEMCAPPLSEDDVQKIAQSVSKKEYDYACNKEPLKSNCNSKQCARRKFGKGFADLEIAPTGLEMYGSDPPLWFLSLDGKENPLELETEDLQIQHRFQRKCIEQLKFMPKIIPTPRWQEKISALVSSSTYTSAPGNKEMFMEYLKDWCTNKAAAQIKEEIVHGKPWLNREANQNRKHHFLLKDLEDHLQKKKFTAYNRTKLTRILRTELDGEKGSLRVSKQDGQEAVIKVWIIPEFEDDMADVQSKIPDMKDKKSYE